MKRLAIVLALAALLLFSALASAGVRLRVDYTLELQQEGEWVVVRETDGFRSGDGLSIRIRVSRDCYCYLAATRRGDEYRLLVPLREVDRGANWLRRGQEYRLPATGAFALDQVPGVERLVLIIAEQQVPELEHVFFEGGELTDETLIDVRDRYSPTYYFQKEVRTDRVTIFGRNLDNRPTVIFEEIVIRHSE